MRSWSWRLLGAVGVLCGSALIVDLAEDGMISRNQTAPCGSMALVAGGLVGSNERVSNGCTRQRAAVPVVGALRGVVPSVAGACRGDAICQREVAGAWGCPLALCWITLSDGSLVVVDTASGAIRARVVEEV